MGNAKAKKCEKCGKDAKMRLPYGPHDYCENHFLEFFEHRVRKTIRVNGLVKPGEKVLVGVSGGKDSLVTLYLLHKIFSQAIRLEALMIDEGIPGTWRSLIANGPNSSKADFDTMELGDLRDEHGFDDRNLEMGTRRGGADDAAEALDDALFVGRDDVEPLPGDHEGDEQADDRHPAPKIPEAPKLLLKLSQAAFEVRLAAAKILRFPPHRRSSPDSVATRARL